MGNYAHGEELTEEEKKKGEKLLKKLRDLKLSNSESGEHEEGGEEVEIEEEEEEDDDGKEPVRLVIVGFGNRGSAYSRYAVEFPKLCKVVAICEPRKKRVGILQSCLGVEDDQIYSDWREFIKQHEENKIGDAVIICTQDKDHIEPSIAFANMGYHILLEKPMAQTEKECSDIVEAVTRNKVMLAVCHVMRYSQASQCVKKCLKDELIGQIINIQHIEPVGFYHFAHSYVRGNWHKEEDSNFILMTKCCHDLDLICYFMGSDNQVKSVQSFGSLCHFHKKNKPKEVIGDEVKRCVECPIERKCPYSAVTIYQRNFSGFCRDLMKDGSNPTIPKVIEELKSDDNPYGQCVYESSNDVCDNQVVNMQFENGATASFSMVATTYDMCRRNIKIFGSLGEITIDGSTVYHKDFRSNNNLEVKKLTTYEYIDTSLKGHGYADFFLMKAFISAVRDERPQMILSDARTTLNSHKLVFRAEQSRIEGKVLKLNENYDVIF